MRFQTRLIFTYGLLVLLLVVTLGIGFYRYQAGFLEDQATESYALVADRIARQLDDLYNTLDFIVVNLVSDVSFKEALVTLRNAPRHTSRGQAEIDGAARTISRSLGMHSLHRAQIDVVVQTLAGDFFSSNFLDHSERRGNGIHVVAPAWFEEVQATDGPPRVVGLFPDPWNPVEPDMKFGVARAVRGAEGTLAIIGAYQRQEDLEHILNASLQATTDRAAHVVAVTPDGGVLHATPALSQNELEPYLQLAESTRGFRENQHTGSREFVAVAPLESGWGRVFVVVDRSVLLETLSVTHTLTILLGLMVFTVSVAYTWVSSRALTRPLRSIQDHIESTDLGNLEVGPPLKHYNDELVGLDRAFNRMKSRLDEAVRREIRSHIATMRARMDSLQAQINPHFLYNTLTVVANRGMELGDPAIGEMCDGIASMLRYSTGTAEPHATIREEITHVEAYLYLMEQRLEFRLVATVAVDPAILDASIPKIVFQQLVENSILHGYRDSTGPLEIAVHGSQQAEWWKVSVRDWGSGFTPERLEELRAGMVAIDREVSLDDAGRGFEIGGLGILNTYTRMHLFYRGNFRWYMENNDGGGATVTLEAPLWRGNSDDD